MVGYAAALQQQSSSFSYCCFVVKFKVDAKVAGDCVFVYIKRILKKSVVLILSLKRILTNG